MIESGGEKNGRGICLAMHVVGAGRDGLLLAMPGVGAGGRWITPCHAWRWCMGEMDYYLPCMALVQGEMDYYLPLVRLLIR